MNVNRTLLSITMIIVTSILLSSCVVQPVVAPLAEEEVVEAVAEATEAPAQEDVTEVAEEIDLEKTLVSMAVDTAPTLDGIVDEPFWIEASTLHVTVEDGSNMGTTEVHLQSVYTSDMIYFLVRWADPIEHFMRSPWVKQDDGSWSKLIDPDDRGGDNNLYYEDKLSFIWPINESIPQFEKIGCYTACHDEEGGDVKPYGNKYTEEEGQWGDIWHWKSVRNLNQLDDQYLDWTQYSPDTPSAGRHSDPKDEGGYVNNQNEENTMPMWMGPEGYPKDGAPGYILDSEKQPFDDSLFVAGDMVPGIVKSAFVGDRGDFSADWQWNDGMWTLEFGRALVTGSEYDVQFDDPIAEYSFGIAIFDNAQVRHAYHSRARTLIFR